MEADMKKSVCLFSLSALIILLFVVHSSVSAQTPNYEKYLSVSDVEKATGLNGIKLDVQALTLSFKRADGKEVLRAVFRAPDEYKSLTGNSELYKPLKGIADEAVIGIPVMPYEIIFLKKTRYCVQLTTFPEEGLKTFVSEDQLKAIAELIVTRL
jgi:hypothetical protein